MRDTSINRLETAKICTSPDSFIKDKPGWIAILSNDITVYQDDGRPNCNPPSSWIRLGDYIRKNKLSIMELKIKFRSNIQSPLPKNAAGYFFCHKSITVHGINATKNFFLIGVLDLETSTVALQLWKIPELVLCGRYVRMIDDCKKDRLIVNEAYHYEPFLAR
jgi:hypothetical protein